MKIAIYIGIVVCVQKILEKFNINIKHQKIYIGFNGTISIICAIIAFALFSLRNGKYSIGENMFFIPITISILAGIGAGKAWRYPKGNESKNTKFSVSGKNVIAMAMPIVLLVFADYAFKLPIYTNILNQNPPSPMVAVVAYLTFASFFSLAVVYDFKINSDSSSKTITLALILYFIFQTTLYCLALMYGLIQRYEVSYTFWAGILSISFAPVILVLFYKSQPKHNKIKV